MRHVFTKRVPINWAKFTETGCDDEAVKRGGFR